MTAQLQGKDKATYIQDMFGRIARHYNLMNRLMTFGQDQSWRRFVVKRAKLPPSGKLLDLATGTGDIAFEATKRVQGLQAIGADFALPMMFVGQQGKMGKSIQWCGADALQIPFASSTFDAITSGYLLRNVTDIQQALYEQLRVVKPGGQIVVLDSTPPPSNLLRPFILIHLKYIIPLMGRLISGKEGADAYQYLPESTQAFKTPDELAEIMRSVGVQNVTYEQFMFETICIHWGNKAL